MKFTTCTHVQSISIRVRVAYSSGNKTTSRPENQKIQIQRRSTWLYKENIIVVVFREDLKISLPMFSMEGHWDKVIL